MRYTITATAAHGAAVKELRLAPADGSPAPAWQPGDHVELEFGARAGTRFRNAYSLVGLAGAELRIAVQLDAGGRGGSRTLHEEFGAGMELDLHGPFGGFALHPGAARTVLLAGGIGITPLVSMAQALSAEGHAFELHYLARDADRAVLLEELRGLEHGALTVHLTGGGARPELAALVKPWREGSTLHACGPAGLLGAVRACAAALGWPAGSVHVESFGARRDSADRPLRVHLRQSGMTLDVAPGTTILDAMIAADAFVSYECKRGECGNCFAQVVSGEPLHRDVCLTPQQRSQGMTTCVSWARGPELELDL